MSSELLLPPPSGVSLTPRLQVCNVITSKMVEMAIYRLCITASKPVRATLDTWPPLPIVIEGFRFSEEGADNIIAALEHKDRVRGIYIYTEKEVSIWVLGRFARAMREPFPELTNVTYLSAYGTTVVLPDIFLGGSAPRLRSCSLDYLPLPALRQLLLSARHLVHLHLGDIPNFAYISPEAMVTCLSAATSLKALDLIFSPSQYRPDRASRRPPSLIRTILPTLTDFIFHGFSEYLEDFFSRIDAPLLDAVNISLFHQISFDVSQLRQFICRTEALSALNIANVVLGDCYSSIKLSQQMLGDPRPRISLSIERDGSDWQPPFLAQVFSSLSPTLSTLQTLTVCERGFQPPRPGWEGDVENNRWLEVFHPFTSVKTLYLSKNVAPLVVPILQQLPEEGVTDVFPMLQRLYLEGFQPSGPIQDGIGQFVAARQSINHTVTVEPWDEPGDECLIR
ncbi:hypothetical protein BJV74DRAFT_986881 [Russula compacta]|nr:hypothetical protein BJV74DRAFT_986881 [Russula compacta]